jgi:hypothetical protein
MLPRTDDAFEDWWRAPAPCESTDPRFEVRRARPSEFDAIFVLVDETFGVKRPRAQYDWLYRRNPHGTARCWLVSEKVSRQIVGSGAIFPWPAARGSEPLTTGLSGDAVTAPGWQRQGISHVRYDAREAHSWYPRSVLISWSNDQSRGARTKHSRGQRLAESVTKGVFVLRAKEFFDRRGWRRPLTTAGGAVADVMLEAWRRMTLGRRSGVMIEPVRRFDSAFDEVTRRCMAWPKFWCPHDAAFLNWRYLDHPTKEHMAFAAVLGGELAGYCVVQIARERAWLLDFVAPQQPRPIARALLFHAVAAARAAGCARLDFIALPGWRHWGLFRRAGFVSRASGMFVLVEGQYEPEVCDLENWQFGLGDTDFL